MDDACIAMPETAEPTKRNVAEGYHHETIANHWLNLGIIHSILCRGFASDSADSGLHKWRV
jgi:hypothetical protein